MTTDNNPKAERFRAVYNELHKANIRGGLGYPAHDAITAALALLSDMATEIEEARSPSAVSEGDAWQLASKTPPNDMENTYWCAVSIAISDGRTSTTCREYAYFADGWFPRLRSGEAITHWRPMPKHPDSVRAKDKP